MKKWLLSLCLLVSLSSVSRSEVTLSTGCMHDLTNWTTIYIEQLTINEMIVNRIVISTTTIKGFDISVYFSPYEDCEKQWIDIITKASSYVYVSCFGITNPNITAALINKRKQGLRVLVCEDKMQSGSKYDQKQNLINNGVEVVVKKIQLLEHNKCIVVDGVNAIIGSWNLSGNNPKSGAQAQDNSIVVFKNVPDIVSKIENAILRIYQRDKIIK